ncbi:hypothetical protein B0H10DRAFT_2187655 [Mycena sp. CBHHK59/15]|nr:hypothetical protein B0H10DRAFT_2187655 [Mycena sp. CBHHK59/15]
MYKTSYPPSSPGHTMSTDVAIFKLDYLSIPIRYTAPSPSPATMSSKITKIVAGGYDDNKSLRASTPGAQRPAPPTFIGAAAQVGSQPSRTLYAGPGACAGPCPLRRHGSTPARRRNHHPKILPEARERMYAPTAFATTILHIVLRCVPSASECARRSMPSSPPPYYPDFGHARERGSWMTGGAASEWRAARTRRHRAPLLRPSGVGRARFRAMSGGARRKVARTASGSAGKPVRNPLRPIFETLARQEVVGASSTGPHQRKDNRRKWRGERTLDQGCGRVRSARFAPTREARNCALKGHAGGRKELTP